MLPDVSPKKSRLLALFQKPPRIGLNNTERQNTVSWFNDTKFLIKVLIISCFLRA